MPTIMSVVSNMAICPYPAPAASKDAASGNAMNPGMRIIEPSTAARAMPVRPDSLPRILDMVEGSNTARPRPMSKIMGRNCGRRFSNAFQPFFKAATLFFLSHRHDHKSKMAVMPYRAIIDTFFLHVGIHTHRSAISSPPDDLSSAGVCPTARRLQGTPTCPTPRHPKSAARNPLRT